jgi:hypothetical protein
MVASQGTFTGSGAVAAQAVAHGLGKTPKALLIWGNADTQADGNTADYTVAIGATDGTNVIAVSGASEDAAAAANAARGGSDEDIVYVTDPSGTVIAEAVFTSWDATNFTITWSNADTGIYHFLAIGGPEVQAAVGATADIGATTVATTGLGFIPRTVFGLMPAIANSSLPATSVTSMILLGAATANEQMGLYGISNDAQDPSLTRDAADDTKFGFRDANSTRTLNMDSLDADGFTITGDGAGGSSPVLYLALGSIQAKIINVAQPDSTGTDATTGVGFRPKLALEQQLVHQVVDVFGQATKMAQLQL